jgi:YVTN family beta-propeller protein
LHVTEARAGRSNRGRIPVERRSSIAIDAGWRYNRAVEFRLLGPLEVIDDGRPVDLGRAKEQALLAVLLLHANETVSTDRLVDELWGDDPPASAAKLVSNYVWQLRKALGGAIVTRPPGYAIAVPAGGLDVERFESLVERAKRQEPRAAAATLREALSLWRGPPLVGVPLASFAQQEAERLEDRRLGVLAQRIDHDLALGDHEAVIAELQALVAAHPYRERFRAQLMLALYRSGRQADALEVYRDGRRRFADELGIEPSPALQRLEKAILNQDPALEAPAGIPRSAPARSSQRLHTGVMRDEGRLWPAETEKTRIAARWQPDRDSQELHGAILAADPALAQRHASDAHAESRDDSASVPLRPRVRRSRVGVPAVVFALVAVGVLVLRAAVDETPRVSAPPSTSAGRVAGRIPVPLPGGPFVGKLAFGAGSLWIRKTGTNEVLRIDPRTNRQTARIRVGFSYDSGIAVRGSDVWVTNGEEGTVSRISAAINAVVATIRVGRYPLGIAATEDAVWVANHHSGTVSRIDPWRNRVVATVPVSPPSQFSGPLAAVSADNQVWVADATLSEVIRIDPRRNRANHVSGTGPACGGMMAFRGSVWIASGCDQGIVTRIETDTARASTRIHVPGMAFDVAAGLGSVWVTTLRGLLLRIDPATNQIVGRLQLPDAVSLTIGGGYVWIIDRESRSVLRVEPAN